MLNAYLGSRNRWFSLALLMVISCAAIGRTPREMMAVDDQNWPKTVSIGDSRITIYEPQLESFKGDLLRLRSAFSVVKEDDSEPVFGAVWLDATLNIDAGRRTARAVKIYVGEIRFPGDGAAEIPLLRQAVESDIPRWNLSYSMDDLHAELKALEERKALAQGLKADVPKILFRNHAAVLLSIEGEPAWRIVDGTPYRRLTNTAFFLIQDSQSGKLYLHIPPFWWTADAPLGPWQAVEDAPGAIEALWTKEPKPDLPPVEPGHAATARPEVIPVTEATELIWTDGPAQFVPIAGTDLLYVKNTESDVFLEIETQMTYVLLSGRWYRTPGNRTEWSFVPADRLPADFSRIPLSSEKHHVLACVAGTAQAREAVLDAEIPRTEGVKPGPAPDLAATYDGSPQFAPISGCSVEYAVNTPYSIFYVNRRYYWCNDGIWYDSDLAVGPWFVCNWVPPAIYLIPPSCPYYYVTYCRIFSVSPRAIYFGYYPGYRGCYVWGRTVVYGTGWRYSCWSGNSWYPRPVTWGVGVRYSSISSTWAYRWGGGGTCAWTGLRRPSSWRAPVVSVDAGGRWAGTGYRPSGVGVYRTASVAAPVSPRRPDSLYARQPERLVRPVAPEPRRADPGPRRDPTPPSRVDRPSHPVSPRAPQDHPRTDRPETPRTPPAPRDNPRTPPVAPREHRETPRTPPPAPPPPSPREERESPRTPPPRDNRESPRTPPPAPPPRDNREAPRTPPPAPPPREHREAPRTPPPPPPPREHREAPRNPPPPPPPPREHREAPRNPPPPPPPREHREAPRNPPPPPPREHREPPRNPPPERREAPRDPPRSPDRRRSALQAYFPGEGAMLEKAPSFTWIAQTR